MRKFLTCYYNIFIFFYVVWCSENVNRENRASQLIYGKKVQYGARYQVYLTFFKYHHNIRFCSGSIVSETAILTAAHCFTGSTSVNILFGSRNKKKWSRGSFRLTVAASNFITHPGYYIHHTSSANDIGIIKLNHYIPFSDTVSSIRLPRNRNHDIYKIGKIVMASGWGLTENNEYPNKMHFAYLRILPDEECKEYYSRYFYDSRKSFCATGDNFKSTCYGDSGGPVVFERRLLGVVSSGSKMSCKRGYPVIFTKTSIYYDWIINHIT